MPTYEFKCPFGHEFEVEQCVPKESSLSMRAECPICKAESKRDYSKMKFPGVKGLSKGPDSGAGQTQFERGDSLTEATLTARRMEDSGAFRHNPTLLKQVRANVNALKNMPEEARKIDYDKKGHPLDN